MGTFCESNSDNDVSNPFGGENNIHHVGIPNYPIQNVYPEDYLVNRFSHYQNAICFYVSVFLWYRPWVFGGLISFYILCISIITRLYTSLSLIHLFCLFTAILALCDYLHKTLPVFPLQYPNTPFWGPNTYSLIMRYVSTQLNLMHSYLQIVQELRSKNITLFTFQSLTFIGSIALVGMFLPNWFWTHFIPLGLITMPGFLYHRGGEVLFALLQHAKRVVEHAVNNNKHKKQD